MQITEIKVHLMDEERLKAFVSVTFDNCFAVRNRRGQGSLEPAQTTYTG